MGKIVSEIWIKKLLESCFFDGFNTIWLLNVVEETFSNIYGPDLIIWHPFGDPIPT